MRKLITKIALVVIITLSNGITTYAKGTGYGHTPTDTAIVVESDIMIAISLLAFLIGLSFVVTGISLKAKLKI